MYIESKAWVTNLKQKLACGSILISNKMEYFEFFTRALKPGIHYVEVDQNNICTDTAEKVSFPCFSRASGLHLDLLSKSWFQIMQEWLATPH
jgi:uncharacterized membrane protein